MKICVIGLGWLGAVSAACLARERHQVVAVDARSDWVDAINSGRSPVCEKELEPLIEEQVARGRLCASVDPEAAVRASDAVMICVSGSQQAQRACEQVGRALAGHPGAPLVAVRTTVPPGTTRATLIPLLEQASRRKAGEEFGVCVNPQFLRKGSALHDHEHPPRTVIGELNRASGELAASLCAKRAPLARTDLETAEMVKYVDNAWHALKVAFANEIGSVCRALEVDAHGVMGVFCQDHKLNLSPSYLKPGFAFGGEALPADLRALLQHAHSRDVELPLLSAVLPSNALQVERVVQAVLERGRRRVGLLGLASKAGTDELAESPLVELAERLVGKGCDVRIYDPVIAAGGPAPHLGRLMARSIEEVLAHAQTIVIGNAAPEFAEVPRRIGEGQAVIDLVRVCDSRAVLGVYEGLCW